MAFGNQRVALNLDFVKVQRDQDEYVLVNRAANYLPDDVAKRLKQHLHAKDGDHRSVACWCILCVLRLRRVRVANCVCCVLGVCVLGVFWFGACCRISGSRVVRSALLGPLRRVCGAFWNLCLA